MLSNVLTYWIGDAKSDAAKSKGRSKLWYGSTPDADTEIRTQFGELLNQAEAGKFDLELHVLENRIAIVILLDQLSRNIYRGTAAAFQNDAKSLDIAKLTIDDQSYLDLSYIERVFLYHPLEHSESLQDQQTCVKLFEQLLTEVPDIWREQIQSFTNYAYIHLNIIEKFGRFPHRNIILSRENTPEETEFLDKDSRRFGQ